MLPIRIDAPPEIPMVTLRAAVGTAEVDDASARHAEGLDDGRELSSR